MYTVNCFICLSVLMFKMESWDSTELKSVFLKSYFHAWGQDLSIKLFVCSETRVSESLVLVTSVRKTHYTQLKAVCTEIFDTDLLLLFLLPPN